MGTLEQAGRKRKHKRNLKYALLTAVQLSAVAGIVMMAPNLPSVLAKFGLLPDVTGSGSTLTRARRRMIQKGLLTEKGGFLRITEKGMTEYRILEAQYSILRPNKWDGRWRVLIFDIPEYRKSTRNKIRTTLKHIGFVRLQDSVWAYPYDCEDLVALLKADMKIGKDVLYMIVDELEGDSKLRQEFGLKRSG